MPAVKITKMKFDKYPKSLNEGDSKKSSFWFSITLLVFGAFFVLLALNFYVPTVVPQGARILSLNESKNIMFLGIDEMLDLDIDKSTWKGRSDTIIVAHLNPKANRVNILNIPRDTKIRINKKRREKINFLNAIGGPKLTKRNLEKLLGIKIDYYVIVNLKGLSKLIDSIGGIVVDVPKRMKYTDRTAMLYIDLKPGKQLLNGEEAIQFVRFRHDGLGDIGRIKRQQQFTKAIIKKFMDPVVFAKLPTLASKFKGTVLTNINPPTVVKIANFVKNVPSEKIKIAMLPGDFGQRNKISYWIPSKERTLALVDDFFHSDDKKDEKKIKEKQDTKTN